MKIENITLEVERSNVFQEHSFAIASNSKAFDILSSKIYTNVPLAIVRELSTNASDSHTDAGCADRPFDVHLPNALEPWLTIRDYGTGLSPEDVESIYTTYFKSTRSTSDDFTGCLGLGSKSPFAYTDQFTIVSNWNGKKYTYSAFKNEQSCPSLALLGTTDTDESNGLEIRIPIRPGDAGKFSTAAQQIFPHFKTRPNLTGAAINYDGTKPEIEKPIFAVFDNNRDNSVSYTSKINVVMGQVCYAINAHSVNSQFGHHALVVLKMPIGSCQIAASREEIHYDDRTLNNVNQALANAALITCAELEQRVKDEPYMLAKLSKLARYRNLVAGLSVNGMTQIECREHGKYALKDAALRRGDKLFINQCYTNLNGGDYADRTIFIEEDVADITQNIKNRLRQYIIEVSAKGGRNRFYLAKIEDAARFKELFGDVTAKLSTLPDVPRKPRDNSRTSTRSKPIKLLNDHSNGNLGFEWENVNDVNDVDATDACCVPRNGNWIKWNGTNVRPEMIREIAQAFGFKRVYGIAEKRYETSRVKYKLIELSAVAKDRAEKLIASLDMYALARFQYGGTVHYRLDIKKIAGLSQECQDLSKMSTAKSDNYDIYQRLSKVFDIKMPVAPDYSKVFFKKYPILLAIDWHCGTINMDHIVEYIKMVEATTKGNS